MYFVIDVSIFLSSFEMKSIFRSRLRPALTATQIQTLTNQSHLTNEELEEWHERFYHCYPRGYLSSKEFLLYLQQLQNQKNLDNQLTKSMVKKLFRLLDLNEDKHLNFEEFFLFNILINRGTNEDKLKLVFNLYDRNKEKYFTRQQLEQLLDQMFDLINLPKPNNGLTQRLETILNRTNFNTQNSKISWHTFSTYVLNDPALFELLLIDDIDEYHCDTNFTIITTRF